MVDVNTDYPDLVELAKASVSEAASLKNLLKYEKVAQNALVEAMKIVFAGWTIAVAQVAGPLATGIIQGEKEAEGAFAEVGSAAVNAMFGTSLGSGDTRPFGRGNKDNVGQQVITALMTKVLKTGGVLQPDDAPAKELLGTMVGLAVEGWLNGFIFECLSESETFGILKLDQLGELKDAIINVLGLGRLSRSVLRPFVHAAVVTPAEWKVNQTYRPNLLGAALLQRDVVRGRITREQAREELARQGWSDDRIDAMLTDARKRLAIGDIFYLKRYGGLTDDGFQQLVKDLGYDEDAAKAVALLEETRSTRGLLDNAVSAAESAFIENHIDSADWNSLLSVAFPDEHERGLVDDIVKFKKAARLKRLSLGDMREAVKRGILSMIDFRRWCADEGYDDDAATTLELLLAATINDANEAERLREQIERQKAADAAKKKAEDELRRQQLEQHRLDLLPELADIKRAFVLGLIPMGRYATALRARDYAGGDMAFLESMLQGDRDAYVAEQEKKKQAAITAGQQNLSFGELEKAALTGVISVGDFAARLKAAGFQPGDVGVLTGILQSDLAAKRAEDKRREDAEAALKNKGLSLADAERATKAGIWSVATFRAFLSQAGLNDGAAATLAAVLQKEIDDAAAAEQRRQQIAAEQAQGKPTLGDLEQAVIRGLQPMATYRAFLTSKHYSAGDIQLLVDLLQSKADDAKDARDRHAQLVIEQQTASLTIAQFEQAVARGARSMAEYRTFLTQLRYSPADVEALVAELQGKLDDAAAAKKLRDADLLAKQVKQLSLGQVERAVKTGAATMDDYRAYLAVERYAPADIDLLVSNLVDELRQVRDVETLHLQAADELQIAGVDLGVLEARVLAGDETIAEYRTVLTAHGFPGADVAPLVARLQEQLDSQADARALETTVAGELAQRQLSIADWKAAVKASLRTMADYTAFLLSQGYAAPDVSVLAALLQRELDKAGGA